MVTGAHLIIYSSNAKADQDFFKNILNLSNVDAGQGWLIFALPPSEIAIHPSDENGLHQSFLICDDINEFIKEMAEHNIHCTAIENQRWGNLTYLTLPGGSKLGVYEPKHTRPENNSK